jgi:hypothetical protein
MNQENNQTIRWNNGIASIAGVAGGVLLATCVPLVLLRYGQILGEGKITTMVIAAIIAGSFIVFISAFFGLVMPNAVPGQKQSHDPIKKD